MPKRLSVKIKDVSNVHGLFSSYKFNYFYVIMKGQYKLFETTGLVQSPCAKLRFSLFASPGILSDFVNFLRHFAHTKTDAFGQFLKLLKPFAL